VRVGHLADVHLDASFALFPRNVGRRRRQAIEAALSEGVRRAANENVDALLIAGDLYEHERVSPDTGALLQALFEEIVPTPILIAPGNHDWHGPRSLFARLDWPSNVHVFSGDRLQRYELEDGLTLWGAAHCAPANTDNFLDRFRVEEDGINVALFHGSERSALMFQEEGKVPHAPFRAEQIQEAGLSGRGISRRGDRGDP
jgi:DNA repair protein SbcD/Mre11